MPVKKKPKKMWRPAHWASLKPFGLGEQGPNNYKEILLALQENKGELVYAMRILSQGVCDGCALGTTGIRDWTLDGIHLCNIRLRLLRLNTMPAFDDLILADAAKLANMTARELRDLGRLPYPMVRIKGDRGFRRIGWDEALDIAAASIQKSSPRRIGFYMTSRGMPNEAYYVAQKAARAMGTNNIDNAARICHSPSTTGLRDSIGAAATTCSYSDWLSSDLIVFFGSNVANNQPVATKYLHYAKKNGAKVAVVNNYREPGMERYWIPSVAESALFGTKLTDRFFIINTGADIAFINGVIKGMIENSWIDSDFVREHTADFDKLEAQLNAVSWEYLEDETGLLREDMRSLAAMVADAKKAVYVWSMGITQHTHGVDNVKAIVNLALTKGFVGREGCGLMPIRGHSGVQGGAEMGAYATAYPGGLAVNKANAATLKKHWGFAPPVAKGLTAPEMIDAAHGGKLDMLFSVGGNFLEVLPEPDFVEAALAKITLRVHMDIVLSPQMFVEPADTVLLLPAATRYETPGGVTQTSTERRVMFSPEIPGRRIGEARPEWEVFADLAARVKPGIANAFAFEDTAAVRAEIAGVVPFYDGIQHLQKAGDQFQYGGPHLCADYQFDTPDGKAHFSPVALDPAPLPKGHFLVSTRRGKQFNSMIQEEDDAITGAVREAVLISKLDADRLGLANGEPVLLENAIGALEGRVLVASIKPGNLQVHWPEGNVLIDRKRRSGAGVPDYNAVVTVTRAAKE